MANKLTLNYDPLKGIATPHGLVNATVDGLLVGQIHGNVLHIFSTEHVLDEIRARVAEGSVDPSNIVVTYEDYVMIINKNGRLSEWPSGFCDLTVKTLARIK